MAQQTRWTCTDCRREWVDALWTVQNRPWDRAGCPACGSSSIQQVTYEPVFPGADIGTRVEDVAHLLRGPELPPAPAAPDPRLVMPTPNATLLRSADADYEAQLMALVGLA